jgi:hypothetical protein
MASDRVIVRSPQTGQAKGHVSSGDRSGDPGFETEHA